MVIPADRHRKNFIFIFYKKIRWKDVMVLRKPSSVHRKMTEFEYTSAHKGGNFYKIQKSLKELDKLLKGTEIKKKKK